MPAVGLGVGRRALLVAAFAWGPLATALWFSEPTALVGPGEPFHSQLSVHVRCLALPLLVGGEGSLHAATSRIIAFLRTSQLLTGAEIEPVLAATARLRDSPMPWLLALLVVAFSLTQPPIALDLRELAAASSHASRLLAFASVWYLSVVRPLFSLLLLGWVWRIALWGYLLWRLSRLPLALVPTHADRAFGLGFLERAPAAFAPLLFAMSSVMSSTWAHGVLYHNVSLRSLTGPALVFVVLAGALVLAPLSVFAGPLIRAKLSALPDYAALVAEHGRKVRQRWILHAEPSAPALLEAPEIGPVADTISLYEAVAAARPVPIGKVSLLIIGMPLVLPLAALPLCKLPLREVLMKLLQTLL